MKLQQQMYLYSLQGTSQTTKCFYHRLCYPRVHYTISVKTESLKSLDEDNTAKELGGVGFCGSQALPLRPQHVPLNSSKQAAAEQSAGPGAEPKGLTSNLGNTKIPAVLSQSDCRGDTH